MRRIVVIGASLAGVRAAEALRSEGFAGELHIVGDEPHPPYNRPPLSKGLLTGAQEVEELLLRPSAELDATWWLGSEAHDLDLDARTVGAGERELSFDGLVIASGARPRVWPEPVPDGVMTFRGLADALCLREALTYGPRHVVVLGAGFLGGEIASSCAALGAQVTLVELEQAPLASRLGTEVAGFLSRLHREHGVDLRTGVTVQRFVGNPSLRKVELSDGAALEADLAVVALGIQPNVEWLASSGLAIRGGLLCDARLRCVDAPGVVTAGDVARSPHPLFGAEPRCIGHWTNAVDQARVASRTLLGRDRGAPPRAVPTFWSDLHRTKLRSVGLPELGDESVLLEGAIEDRRFVIGYGRVGVLVGAVAVNLGGRLTPYRQLVERRAAMNEALSLAVSPA